MKNLIQHPAFGVAKQPASFLLLAIFAVLGAGHARAQTTITLAATNLFGGAGDQRATAVNIAGGALYFSGVTTANSSDGLVARYALPMANNAAPVWSAAWPGLPGGDDFEGVAVSTEGVYVAGSSYARTTDNVGGKENKGITVKFPLTGATGGGFGGAIWDHQTPASGAFGYGGGEGLWASLVTVESGTTFIYVTGSGQVNGANGGRFFVSKLDVNGSGVWTRDDSASMVNNAYSNGRGLAALNGNIYVSGYNGDSGGKGYLRKYDPNGTLLWSRAITTGSYIGATALGTAIFAVGQVGSGASANFLVDKWDEAGNLVWSQQYDRNNAEDLLNAVVAFGGRIYAVGSTRGLTAGGADAALLEIDPVTGNLLSTTLFGGTQDDIANGIATDGTDLYVVGETKSFLAGGNTAGQNDAFVLRYTVAQATSITLSPANPVIVPGSNQQFTATGGFSDSSSRPLTNTSSAAWQTAASIPQASYGLGGAFVGGKFYAISGFATTRVGVYDPSNNTWTTAAPLPQLLQYYGITVLDGKIYVAGGDTGGGGDRATLYQYDPALSSWATLAPMPAGPRYGVRAATLNGLIYVVGGYNIGSSSYLNRVEIYNPTNNAWTTGTPLPGPRYVQMMGAINGKIYVAGGNNVSGPLNDGIVFDPANNTWTPIASPLVSGYNSAVLGGKLYAVSIGPTERQLQAYDPVANTWTTNLAWMPTGRHDVGVAADETAQRLFVVGGWNGSYSSALEIFRPGVPEVAWSSSNSAVATISASGVATALAGGSSTITATSASLTGSTLLTVGSIPQISLDPQNQTVPLGSNAIFSVTATGAAPLSYQWQVNGGDLLSATSSSLSIASCQSSNTGNYRVIVSNSGGSVTSAVALLTVILPPAITNQPTSQGISANGTVTFNVGSAGTAPFTAQWMFNGTNLPGATGLSLTLTNASLAQAGTYSALVSNGAGNATSIVAVLTVTDLRMYAGISIAGAVGRTYNVDARNDLNGNWLNLTNIVLPSSPYFFIDMNSPQYPRRFYRAVLLP